MAGENDFNLPTDGEGKETPPVDPSGKAKKVVWLVAGGCLLIGGLDVALYLVECQRKHLDVSLLHCLWLSIPLVIGVVLLVKTPALADWINDWLDQ